MSKIATPEPNPLLHGDRVPDLLINRLAAMRARHGHVRGWALSGAYDRAIDGVKARSEFGFAKYGQVLMTGDGRDGLNDAAQELIDAMQYAYKAKLNGINVTPLRELWQILGTLLSEPVGPAVEGGLDGLSGLAAREA